MKILLISTEFNASHMGGAEKMVYQLSSELSVAGHEAAILTCEKSGSVEGVNIINIPKPLDLSSDFRNSRRAIISMFNINWLFRLKGIFKNYDIIHLHNIHSHSILFYSIIAAKKLKKKIVWTPHDYWFICPHQSLLTEDGNICKKTSCDSDCSRNSTPRIMKLVRNKAINKLLSVDSVLPPSRYVAKKVIEFGMDRGKVNVVYNGIQILRIDESRIPGNNIVYTGYLDKRKGPYVLLEAIKDMKKSMSDFKCVFIGHGPDKQDLEGLATKWNIESNVIFTGRLNDDEYNIQLNSARMAIVPSIWPEIFGLVAAEALSRKIPVIASNIGALPEIVIDGKTGLLFKPGDSRELADKILSIYNDESRLRRFGENGYQHAKANFDIGEYSKQVERVYLKLMTSQP